MTVAVSEPGLLTPLMAALDGLALVDPVALGERDLGGRATGLLRARGVLEGLLAHTIAEGEARGLAGTTFSPHGRTDTWVSELAPAKLGRSDTAKIVVRAATVIGLPLVAGLHAGGDVSTAFLDAAGAGLRQLPTETHASWDALLAGEARDLDPGDVARLLAQVRVMVDPDQVNDDAGKASRRSSLHISPFGSQGSWAIHGTLHGLEGELAAKMIAHYAKPRDAQDTRSRGERNAAALVQLCRIAERATGDREFRPAPRGAAGHLVVHTDIDTWHGRPGAPAATTEHTVLDPGAFEAVRCTTPPEVMVYQHIAADTAPQAGKPTTAEPAPDTDAERDARLVRWILAGLIGPEIGIRIEPLAYAREARVAPRAMWDMLVARDGHCVMPGCTRDPSWCEAHHAREWKADEGPTDLNNNALVCWEHHTWLHRNNQHLHPPWCSCHNCPTHRQRRVLAPHEWLVLGHPPMTAKPPPD